MGPALSCWLHRAVGIAAALAPTAARAQGGGPPPPLPLNPYPAVHGGAFSGSKVSASPDPLNDYKWDLESLADPFAYQVHRPLFPAPDALL